MENKNGQGIFYGVIGVATLVVAIIGATFAYFSASQTAGNGVINGTTNDELASALSLGVQRVTYTYGTGEEPGNDKLVPAVLTLTGSDDTTNLNKALTAKCVKDGYTGCHVYDITVSSNQPIATANFVFDLDVDASVKDNWKYLVFEGSSSAATAISKMPTAFEATPATSHELAITGGLSSTAKHYFLMVYLENVEHSQNNDASDPQKTSETGTYSGTVSLQAAGGQVKASFTA